MERIGVKSFLMPTTPEQVQFLTDFVLYNQQLTLPQLARKWTVRVNDRRELETTVNNQRYVRRFGTVYGAINEALTRWHKKIRTQGWAMNPVPDLAPLKPLPSDSDGARQFMIHVQNIQGDDVVAWMAGKNAARKQFECRRIRDNVPALFFMNYDCYNALARMLKDTRLRQRVVVLGKYNEPAEHLYITDGFVVGEKQMPWNARRELLKTLLACVRRSHSQVSLEPGISAENKAELEAHLLMYKQNRVDMSNVRIRSLDAPFAGLVL